MRILYSRDGPFSQGALDEIPHPTDDQIETAIEGNLCRCGAYPQILKAIKTVIDDQP